MSSVVTRGFGSFGSTALVVTRGYAIGAVSVVSVEINRRLGIDPEIRRFGVAAEDRRFGIDPEIRRFGAH